MKDNSNTGRNGFGTGKVHEVVIDFIVYAYVLLFFYTACSKLITYSSFLKVLSDLPVIGNGYQLVAPGVIFIELLFGVLLVLPGTRMLGLRCSLGLMLIFTSYLIFHVMTGSKLPCSCGGVISAMTWPQHIALNFGYIILAILGLYINNKKLVKTKISTRGDR